MKRLRILVRRREKEETREVQEVGWWEGISSSACSACKKEGKWKERGKGWSIEAGSFYWTWV
jgi:hypothetical protein